MTVSLELAITAIKAGRKQEGRQLLNLLIQQDPNSEMAWLWMSSVVGTDEQRARCLYHVLSINPRNDLAQRGLKKLGIDISDSRPVKIPSESKPIHIPIPSMPVGQASTATPAEPKTVKQTEREEERRPFLIDPQTITAELPFVPIHPPFKPVPAIQASPEILSLKVDDEDNSSAGSPDVSPPVTQRAPEVETSALASAVVASLATTQSDVAAASQNGGPDTPAIELPAATPEPQTTAQPEAVKATEPDQVVEAAASPATKQPEPSTETQPLSEVEPKSTPAVNDSPSPQSVQQANGNQPAGPLEPAPMEGQPQPSQHPEPPLMTRRSQPIFVNYPPPNTGFPQNSPVMPPQPDHAAGTMPMGQYPPMPGTMPMHSNAPTMGMPPGYYQRPPSEPVQVIIHPSGAVSSYGYPGGPSIHSSATAMMPTMSEAEARARLMTGQSIPTASAAAMPLQNMEWGANPAYPTPQPGFYQQQPAEEEEEGEEINLLAVIIFGTLSVTALGGIGMLILLMITTSTYPGAG
jgi:hypothetical protein